MRAYVDYISRDQDEMWIFFIHVQINLFEEIAKNICTVKQLPEIA